MEGLEIVITPRIIERAVYGTVIVILLSLVILNVGGDKCIAPQNSATGLVTSQINQTNETAQSNTVLLSSGSCQNKLKDGDETDIDCGGSCPTCSEFQTCNKDSDCSKGMDCYQHIKCIIPSCDDGIKNQDETEIDCGGLCKGYWWASDKSCHDKEEPSGRLEAKVNLEYLESELSKNVVLDKLTIELTNGLSKKLALKADIYALDSSGEQIFEDRDGKSIPVESITFDSLDSGESLTKILDFSESTRKTLPGIKADDEFQIAVELKDGDNELVERKTWTNTQ